MILRARSGSAIASISTILSSAALKPITVTGRALSPKASPGVDGVTWADYGQDLVAKSSSAAMRPISLSSINCHSSCRSRSLPVPAVAATFAQASAALTETEP